MTRSQPGVVSREMAAPLVEVNGVPWHCRDVRRRYGPTADDTVVLRRVVEPGEEGHYVPAVDESVAECPAQDEAGARSPADPPDVPVVADDLADMDPDDGGRTDAMLDCTDCDDPRDVTYVPSECSTDCSSDEEGGVAPPRRSARLCGNYR